GFFSCFSRSLLWKTFSSRVALALWRWKTLDTVLLMLGFSRQSQQYSTIRAMSAVRVHSSSEKVLDWVPQQISSANMNRRLCLAGRSSVYRLNNVGAKTDPAASHLSVSARD